MSTGNQGLAAAALAAIESSVYDRLDIDWVQFFEIVFLLNEAGFQCPPESTLPVDVIVCGCSKGVFLVGDVLEEGFIAWDQEEAIVRCRLFERIRALDGTRPGVGDICWLSASG